MAQVDDERRASEDRSGIDKTKLLLGRVAAVLGILVSLSIVLTPNAATIFTFTAIVLGGVGYALGARRLGVAALVIAVAALVLGFMLINGYIPGIDPPGVDDQSPQTPRK